MPLDNDPVICVFMGDDSFKNYGADMRNLMEDTLKSPPKKNSIIYETIRSLDEKIEDIVSSAEDKFRESLLFGSVNNKIHVFLIAEMHGDIWDSADDVEGFTNRLSKICSKFMSIGTIINVHCLCPVDLRKAAINEISTTDTAKRFMYLMVKELDATVYHIPTLANDLDSYPISKTLAFIVLVISTRQFLENMSIDKFDDNGNYSWITARLFEIDYMDMAFNYICRKMLQAQGNERRIGSGEPAPDVAGMVNDIFKDYTDINIDDADSYVPIPVIASRIEKKQSIFDKLRHKDVEYEYSYRLRKSEINEYISKLSEKHFQKIEQAMGSIFDDSHIDNFIKQIIKKCKYFYQLAEIGGYIKNARSYFTALEGTVNQEESIYLRNILSRVYAMKVKFLDRADKMFDERYEIYSRETANVSIAINDKLTRIVLDMDIGDIFEFFECGTMNLCCSEDELIDAVKVYRDELQRYIRSNGKIAVIKSQYECMIENSITMVRNFGTIGIEDTNDKLKWYLGSDDGGAACPEIIDKNVYRETVGSLMFTHPVPHKYCERLPY